MKKESEYFMNQLKYITLSNPITMGIVMVCCGLIGCSSDSSSNSPPADPIAIEQSTVTLSGQFVWPETSGALSVAIDGVPESVDDGEWSHTVTVNADEPDQDFLVDFLVDGEVVRTTSVTVDSVVGVAP